MVDAGIPQTLSGDSHPATRSRRTVTRVMAATAIAISALAVAAPSWAGPVMGC